MISILIIFTSFSQGSIFENSGSIKLEKNNLGITFFKKVPWINIDVNGSQYTFAISSIIIGNEQHTYLKNIPWQSNITSLKNGIYCFNMSSKTYGILINISYYLLEGQKYLNFSGNGLLVKVKVSSQRSLPVTIFEHIIKGNISYNVRTFNDNFNIHEKLKKLGFDKISYIINNGSFYASSNNSTEEDIYQTYPNNNGTIESLSFISFNTFSQENLFSASMIIFYVTGFIIGLALIFIGTIFIRKKD